MQVVAVVDDRQLERRSAIAARADPGREAIRQIAATGSEDVREAREQSTLTAAGLVDHERVVAARQRVFVLGCDLKEDRRRRRSRARTSGKPCARLARVSVQRLPIVSERAVDHLADVLAIEEALEELEHVGRLASRTEAADEVAVDRVVEMAADD